MKAVNQVLAGTRIVAMVEAMRFGITGRYLSACPQARPGLLEMRHRAIYETEGAREYSIRKLEVKLEWRKREP